MPNYSQLEFFLEKYFEGRVTALQKEQFRLAFEAYVEWNEKVNVISRKDIENLAERHFLHSLAIAKHISFVPETRVLDVGTGGGFPGIPLAIMFPEVSFHLVDSVNKKIKVVAEIVQAAGLANVEYSVQRAEEMKDQYDFVLSRAVSSMDKFIPWVRKRIHCRNRHKIKNGILYLRGGDVKAEMAMIRGMKGKWKAIPLKDYFEGEFFESKFLLDISLCTDKARRK
jgi:16S rRNA (guanine527-N7)-methyltransferase